MKEVILNVEGMACGGCEKRINNALMEIEGVTEVTANHTQKKVIIKMKENVDLSEIKEMISELGFEVKE